MERLPKDMADACQVVALLSGFISKHKTKILLGSDGKPKVLIFRREDLDKLSYDDEGRLGDEQWDDIQSKAVWPSLN